MFNVCRKCIVACYQPWRHIIPTAYIVSTGVFLLLITAGVLLPSLRRVLLSPGRSMTVLVLGGGGGSPALFSGGCRRAEGQKWEASKRSERHRARTGKLNRLPAPVPGGNHTACAHLVVLGN